MDVGARVRTRLDRANCSVVCPLKTPSRLVTEEFRLLTSSGKSPNSPIEKILFDRLFKFIHSFFIIHDFLKVD